MNAKFTRPYGSVLNAAIVAAAVGCVTCPSAQAGILPTHGAVTHFDLNSAGAVDFIPAFGGIPAVPGPAVGGAPLGAFATGEFVSFVDPLQSASVWHWETLIGNPNAFPVAFVAGWFFPDGDSPIIGFLGLSPGATFLIDIHVNDVPEVAPWTWFVTSGLGFPIYIDNSVTENLIGTGEAPGSFDFDFSSYSDEGETFFIVDPDLRPVLTLEAVPAPGTAVLLAIAGLATRRRRRR